MYFEWQEGAAIGELQPHALDAETLEGAKMQAAMIYAGASFHRTPPKAYRIEGPGGMAVYRFPEHAWAAQ